ncbi:DNA polymerase III subunit beta [Burkholderia cenocepacia]|nr:DNA polymerase III subunit beta [Burkholderia cenocepacia]
MQTIHFTLAQLKATQCLAAENDIRYYFNGVFVEATPFETRLVATDGTAIGVTRCAIENDIEGDVGLIIPNATIDGIKAGKRDMQAPARVEIEDGQHYLCVEKLSLRVTFAPVDGKFPVYRRVFPQTVSGEVGQFDPELLTAFAKAGKILRDLSHNPVPRLAYNGDSARVSFDNYDDFAGVIMGWRAPKNSRPADTSWI